MGRVAAVAEQVEGLQSSLRHKLDKAALQQAKHEVQEARQQGQATAQALADLQNSLHQQGQGHTTSLHRLEALIATCAQGIWLAPTPASPLRPHSLRNVYHALACDKQKGTEGKLMPSDIINGRRWP